MIRSDYWDLAMQFHDLESSMEDFGQCMYNPEIKTRILDEVITKFEKRRELYHEVMRDELHDCEPVENCKLSNNLWP